MSVPLLLGSNSNALSAAERFSAAARGLRILGWTGLLTVALGLSDVLLAVVVGRGAPDAAFAAIGSAFGSFMVVAIGSGALVVSALGQDIVWLRRCVAIANIVVILVVLGAVVVWSGGAAEALRAELPVVQHAHRREVARVLVSSAAFIVLHATLAVACLRTLRSGAPA